MQNWIEILWNFNRANPIKPHDLCQRYTLYINGIRYGSCYVPYYNYKAKTWHSEYEYFNKLHKYLKNFEGFSSIDFKLNPADEFKAETYHSTHDTFKGKELWKDYLNDDRRKIIEHKLEDFY